MSVMTTNCIPIQARRRPATRTYTFSHSFTSAIVGQKLSGSQRRTMARRAAAVESRWVQSQFGSLYCTLDFPRMGFAWRRAIGGSWSAVSAQSPSAVPISPGSGAIPSIFRSGKRAKARSITLRRRTHGVAFTTTDAQARGRRDRQAQLRNRQTGRCPSPLPTIMLAQPPPYILASHCSPATRIRSC